MPPVFEVFEDRLKAAIRPEPLKHWCERVGVNHSTLNSALQRRTVPKAEFLIQISLALGKSLDWLLGLTDEPARMLSMGGSVMVEDGPRALSPSDGVSFDADELDWSDFMQVPLYAVRASAGHGAIIDRESVKSHLAFRRDFICNQLQITHNDLFCVEVDGVSMEPVLRHRHPVLIDPHATSIVREGPYLLRLEESLLLKNLQRLPGGRLRIWSENQTTNAYPPIEIAWPAPEGTDISILGRVRWSDIVF